MPVDGAPEVYDVTGAGDTVIAAPAFGRAGKSASSIIQRIREAEQGAPSGADVSTPVRQG